MKDRQAYLNKKVLIIGGGGFVGKNLIKKLIREKAKITIYDNKVVETKSKNIKYIKGDVRNLATVRKVVLGKDLVIVLASLRPIESVKNPILDLETTCVGALNILEAARHINTPCKIVFFGSSLEFGDVKHLPVSEKNNIPKPDSFYGVHKGNLSHYSRIYWKLYGVDSTVLRFSNIYGPEKGISEKMSIVNLFINLIISGKDITIYGEGSQKRDYLYVDDALEALKKVFISRSTEGLTFNIGFGKPTSLISMARSIVSEVGKGEIIKVPWPENYKIEPRDYYTNYKKAKRMLNWSPKINLKEGIRLSIESLKE